MTDEQADYTAVALRASVLREAIIDTSAKLLVLATPATFRDFERERHTTAFQAAVQAATDIADRLAGVALRGED